MCHNRTNNNKINCLHERCLRLIYNDKKSSFENLLEKGGSVSVHHRNLRTLAVELFKVLKSLSLVIFADAFLVRKQSQYNMRNYSYFATPRAKTVNHGLESFSYIGSKLWDSIPFHMKEIDLLMNLNMLLKRGNLICAHADFAKFVYKILDICSRQKKQKKNKHIYLVKSEYHNRFLPFTLRCTFTFPCLRICLFVGVYGAYLKFDLRPLALISVLFKYYYSNINIL